MSIAVAVHKDQDIVIAADSQDNFGSNRVSFDNYSSPKIILLYDSYVATTGWGLYEDILEHYASAHPDIRLDTKPHIF